MMTWPFLLLFGLLTAALFVALGAVLYWWRQTRAVTHKMDRRRVLMETISVPLAMFDHESGRQFANTAFKALDGDVPGSLTSACADLSRRVLRTRGAHVESLTIVVGGVPRSLTLNAFPVPDGVGVQVTDLTVTERLMADLSRHIAAQDDVLNQVGQAIAIFGPDRRMKYTNEAYLKLWDLPDDMVAREPTIVEFLDDLRTRRLLPEESDFAANRRHVLSQFDTLVEPREELMHLPNGTTLHTRVAPHPFGGLIFTHADVTDKLALERKYNTAIAVQRETLDNLAEGVAFFGLDRRLQLVNPAFCRIWGLDPQSLSDAATLDFVIDHCIARTTPPEMQAGIRLDLLNDIEQRRVRHGVDVHIDGKHTEVTWVPMPDGATLFLCLDVTDRARAEGALRERARALEEADRLKTEFIANVSYELRTPLNTIIGFAEILSQAYFGPLNDRQREYTGGILESSGRLLSLINDILDLATIEAGYMVLERESLPLGPLLTGTMGLVRERARVRDLALVTDVDDPATLIHGDGKRLRQAVFNLLSNACTFTPAGGMITVGARTFADHVEIYVSDTGVGIPDIDQERIFGRFEKRGRNAGVGLGLSLVKSIIELHGGTVELASRPGEGTRIACTLPLSPDGV